MQQFFTIPDPDLTQESSVDPLGLQVVWTSYGQDIFEEKLTTIANDLRVFTFNLFHHHVLDRLFKNHQVEIQKARAFYNGWQTEFDIKAGLLIFLEDLVTWTFFKPNDVITEDDQHERLGILGLAKARLEYFNSRNEIVLIASKRSGLLKNQLNLGMTGRYKGPMMNMGFFDRSLAYLPNVWEQVDRFMMNWKDATELEESLINLLTKHLLVIGSGKKEFPQLYLKDIKNIKLWNQISGGYFKCFGSRTLRKEIRAYWKDKLGLTSGARSALYKEVSSLNGEEIDHFQIFKTAKMHLLSEPLELNKIESILDIEPFLSHSEYLIRYLSQLSIKTLQEEEKNLQLLRNEIVKTSKSTIDKNHPRLKELQLVMSNDGDLEVWLNAVLAFHRKLMEQRGGTAWLELDAKKNFKHYFAPGLNTNINTVQKYLATQPWFHTYYLETLRSINQGLH